MNHRASRRGLYLMGCLALSLLLGGGALAVHLSSGTATSRPEGAGEPLVAAKIAFANEEYVRAEVLLRSLVAAADGGVEARVLLGRTLLELGKLAAAREVLAGVAKDFPGHVPALLAFSRCLERLGQSDQALANLRKASEIAPDDPRVLRELGMAQHRSGDTTGAALSMRKSLRLAPGQEDLARLMADAGRQHPAQSHHVGMPWSEPGSAGPMPHGPNPHGYPQGRSNPHSGQIPGMPGAPGMPGRTTPGGTR